MKIIESNNTPDMIPTGKVAVTVYFDQRLYGGPEEGGWWYRSPTVVRTYLFNSLRKAKVFLRDRGEVFANVVADGVLDDCDIRDARIYLEFPGIVPEKAFRNCDGHTARGTGRPYHLRQVYRDRELIGIPHYC